MVKRGGGLPQAVSAAFASQDLEVGDWMFAAVPKTLQAVAVHQPSFVTTSEARLLRTFLDRRGYAVVVVTSTRRASSGRWIHVCTAPPTSAATTAAR